MTVGGGGRSIYLHLNSQPGPNSLNSFRQDTSDLENGIVSFWYIPLRNDSTNDLQIVDILDLSGLVFVDNNGQPQTIEIDGFKPTITLTWPDLSTWTETKVVSATDDESGIHWDYHFINAEEANVDPCGHHLEIRCYLGDFLPFADEGTPYTESDEITLTEENNGHYICFRSRRVKPEFWDILNRDRGGTVSNLIQGIDSSPPTISFNIGNGRITPTVTDPLSGVQTDSLAYKLIEADAECGKATFNGGETDYTSGVSIDGLSDYYGSRFCFTASDNLGNTTYEKTDILSAPSRPRRDNTPPNIIITNPDDSDPGRSKTVSADSDSDDVDDSSWHWQIYDPESDECNEALMASGTTVYQAGAVISLDSEAHNGQSICFSASDDEDNEAFTASDVINGIDRQAPTIIISLVDKYAIAVDDDNDITSWEYQIIPANTICSEEASNAPLLYIEARAVSLAGSENHKACFKVVDQAGNTSFAASAVFLTRAPAEQTEENQAETDEDEDNEEDEVITPGNSNSVSNKIVSEIDDDSNAGGTFYLWWLLLSLAIFFVVLFIIKKRRDEEDA